MLARTLPAALALVTPLLATTTALACPAMTQRVSCSSNLWEYLGAGVLGLLIGAASKVAELRSRG